MVCIGMPSLCLEKAIIAAAHIPQDVYKRQEERPMEVTINYNGQAVTVEVTLEVYEFLDRAEIGRASCRERV